VLDTIHRSNGRMPLLKERPDFDSASELFRYIPEIYYQDSRRAKVPAFMEDAEETRNGLSVNSGEVETITE
jgi:hypothetical protein